MLDLPVVMNAHPVAEFPAQRPLDIWRVQLPDLVCCLFGECPCWQGNGKVVVRRVVWLKFLFCFTEDRCGVFRAGGLCWLGVFQLNG
jgi:hypothetical protein